MINIYMIISILFALHYS